MEPAGFDCLLTEQTANAIKFALDGDRAALKKEFKNKKIVKNHSKGMKNENHVEGKIFARINELVKCSRAHECLERCAQGVRILVRRFAREHSLALTDEGKAKLIDPQAAGHHGNKHVQKIHVFPEGWFNSDN